MCSNIVTGADPRLSSFQRYKAPTPKTRSATNICPHTLRISLRIHHIEIHFDRFLAYKSYAAKMYFDIVFPFDRKRTDDYNNFSCTNSVCYYAKRGFGLTVSGVPMHFTRWPKLQFNLRGAAPLLL